MEKRAKNDAAIYRIETAVKRLEKAIEKKEYSVSLPKNKSFETLVVENKELSESNKIIERRLNGAIKNLKNVLNDV